MTDNADAAASRHGRGRGVKSRDARSVALTLLDQPAPVRRSWLRTLGVEERAVVFAEVQAETGSLYALWHDDPAGFIEDVLGETMWGRQREMVEALALPGVKRVAVPAGFGVGKTYSAGRLTAWAGAVNAIGTIKVVTTATRDRQVVTQLWPHIKTAVAKGKLPGRTDTKQWVAEDLYGNLVQIAYGFTAPPHDEAAMQGIHGTPKLILIVDEAGGIAATIGKGTNNLLTGDARMIATGNPAMNEPGSWLENLSKEGNDPDEPSTVTVQISALHSPAITGEPTPICRACVPNLDNHTIAGGVPSHLPDWDWLHRTLREYGVFLPDADRYNLDVIREECRKSGQPYLIAKVLAEFPRDVGNQVMPSSWVEAAATSDDPMDHSLCEHAVLGDLSIPCTAATPAPGYAPIRDFEEESDLNFLVKKGAWVRLGIDIASDGGDEFAIYRAIGDVVHKRHVSSGAQNADSTRVAHVILQEILAAERLATALGSPRKVRVKIDKNGLGWGVVGRLNELKKEKKHDAEIVGVMVSEGVYRDDEAAEMRPYRKRDEMWLAGRFLMKPLAGTGAGKLRLRVDEAAMRQLSLPLLGNNSSGFTVIESKQSMKKRGLKSPDRAEAVLLAVYEPVPIGKARGRGLLN